MVCLLQDLNISPYVGKVLLRDVRPPHGQDVLTGVCLQNTLGRGKYQNGTEQKK